MNRRALLSFACGVALALGLSRADDAWACPVEYVLKENDTLQSIAHQIYNDPAKCRSFFGPIRIGSPSTQACCGPVSPSGCRAPRGVHR